VELPDTLSFLQLALVERIYPLLQSQFGVSFLPDPTKLRLAEGFVVKYDAGGGQTKNLIATAVSFPLILL
jgi:hypothetical protein